MILQKEDFRNEVRRNFWYGYELGLKDERLPERYADENIWHGWSLGSIEALGWHRLTAWQARLKRTRQFVGVLYKFIRSFRNGIQFGFREKDGVLRIHVILGKWDPDAAF
jgi:hypothetical protein